MVDEPDSLIVKLVELGVKVGLSLMEVTFRVIDLVTDEGPIDKPVAPWSFTVTVIRSGPK